MKSPDIDTPTLIAPPEWGVIDFLSDLHLAPATPLTLAALAQHLERTPAQAVFLLGDIFEVWIGDDARFEGFEAACTALLQRASQRHRLFFMAGNRDFLLGKAMAQDAGMQLLPDPVALEAFGQRVLLSHGDALCLDDHDYQRFRAQVRGADWQREFLAQPLAQRRAIARQMREASELNKRQQSPQAWSDLDANACRDWLRQTRCQVLLHGHTHRPAAHDLGDGLWRWVLSDWDLEAELPRADVLRLDAQGLRRIALL
ncbi:UDP-2,3-diacylglucosamine diphosphatase [Paucibacter sp. XJ19-41]|uniref:UDP-2,3-diacylglucosamine diphosphatase n=1 Tax=Paucibacter sp. XJ19-41 TaxID=2927824 RepID=UPI002349777D|nr:UDP-2,3-diacylglucosamine diphosphatase [Paucibacter sp. XJ19-41]MDC6167458.1 UDP-2,3-diacylglucosamine diphosphatase [Paucibacter sp. XJ19-41]